MTALRARRHQGYARLLVAALLLVLFGTGTAAMVHAHRGDAHEIHDCGACRLAAAPLALRTVPRLTCDAAACPLSLPPSRSTPCVAAPSRLPARAPPSPLN